MLFVNVLQVCLAAVLLLRRDTPTLSQRLHQAAVGAPDRSSLFFKWHTQMLHCVVTTTTHRPAQWCFAPHWCFAVFLLGWCGDQSIHTKEFKPTLPCSNLLYPALDSCVNPLTPAYAPACAALPSCEPDEPQIRLGSRHTG